ncbi:MAG: Holliday junction resolvase RuvX [Vulcanimicrobiaceae bacterium]
MILALDVGSRRIGLAISDPGERFAFPLRTLERRSLHDDLEAIVAAAREYGARTIVVGDPLALSGARGPAAEKMDAFVAVLARAFDGEIARVDERLTTAQANRTLLAADLSRKRRRASIDPLAAALILEGYLARRNRERA